jgi:hypothetical protein
VGARDVGLEQSRKRTREGRCSEVRPRKDHRGVDLISDVLPSGGLWYSEPTQSAMQPGTQSFAAGLERQPSQRQRLRHRLHRRGRDLEGRGGARVGTHDRGDDLALRRARHALRARVLAAAVDLDGAGARDSLGA